MKNIKRLVALLALLLVLAQVAAVAEPALKYWIGVDVAPQRTTVYSTADNRVLHCWICSTGVGGRTPRGTFYLPEKRRQDERTAWYHISKYHCYVRYATRIRGAYLFHSIPFNSPDEADIDTVAVAQLGTPASHGCVRLPVFASQWIASHCPPGTMVVIHKGPNDSRIVKALGGPAADALTEPFETQPDVTRVLLDREGAVDMAVGDTLTLNAAWLPEAADTELTWKTSKPKVAAVDQNGTITALKTGTATITCRAANYVSASVTVNVTDPYLPVGVTLTAAETMLIPGQTLALSAVMTPDTARSGLTWISSSKKRATVDADGNVTALAEGTVKITVKTRNGKKASVTLKIVDPFKPVAIALNPAEATLRVGETLALNAVMTPDTARSDLTWTSSSKRRAVVDADGNVTALTPGTVRITVKTRNGKRASVKIRVVE